MANNDLFNSLPKGTILLFAGNDDDLDSDVWRVADGTNGTVNLKGRIPYGLPDGQQIGKTDGTDTHTHSYSTTTGAPINGLNNNVSQGDRGFVAAGNDHQHRLQGATDPFSGLPPVTYVKFIQKIV
jgi:hypothetical protein